MEEKLSAGRRLDLDDGLALLACPDPHALGRLADNERRRRHGSRAFYNVNCHINYSNVCVLACSVCGFSRRTGQAGAYEMSVEAVAEQAAEAARAGASEVHITGGLHPDWPLERYEAMLRAVRRSAPTVHIKAFTAAEVDHIASMAGVTVEAVLRRLMAVGLDSLPGGGAEIFDPRVRSTLFPRKLDAARWQAVHRQAHRLGLRSNATMLYGHIETDRHRVEHLLALRALQDETGGFQAIVPLPFIPRSTNISRSTGETPATRSSLDDLRTVAVARLLLDNFDHVKTFWVMHGLQLSQLALHFGADDLDGTVTRYTIVEPDGGDTSVTVPHLRKLIEEAGLTPAERDSFYRERQR